MCVADRLALHGAQTEALRGVVGRLLQAAVVEHQRLGLPVLEEKLAVVGAVEAARQQPGGFVRVEAGTGKQAQRLIGHGRIQMNGSGRT